MKPTTDTGHAANIIAMRNFQITQRKLCARWQHLPTSEAVAHRTQEVLSSDIIQLLNLC